MEAWLRKRMQKTWRKKSEKMAKEGFLVDVSNILYFFLLGGGEGSTRCQEVSGVAFLLKIPVGGGVLPREGGGARGLSAGNFGGGAKYFFRGRNAHQGFVSAG